MNEHPGIYPDRRLDDLPVDARGALLRISAQEVRGQRVGRCVDQLMHLSDYPHRVKRLMCGLLLEVEGFEDDHRELHQIPECRQFFKALHREWPYWMHFLAPLREQWQLLALCVLTPDLDALRSLHGNHPAFSNADFKAFIQSLMTGMDHLQRKADLSEVERAAALVVSLEAIRTSVKPTW